MKIKLPKGFLDRSEETGRFIVYSEKTGITYCVEAIDTNKRIVWGDVNPATDKVEGSYGSKYKGSIKAEESLILEENGFQNIQQLEAGVSPLGEIERIDSIRYEEGYRPKT